MAVPMANDPPFATLNHFAADLGIPSESDLLRIGIRRLGSKGKIRLVAAISHTLTRLALLLRGDEVDNLRFRLHLPNDLADLFLRQLGLGEPDEVERASHV
jgi:hypothetical protein